jgi:ribosomal protein S18 acetylase RimI-like enzyme
VSTDIDIVSAETTTGAAAVLAARGWLEGIERGFSGSNEFNMSHHYRSLLALVPNGRDRVPAGVITWNPTGNEAFLFQSYVDPEFRGRGVFTALWNELIAQAMNMKIVKIQSFVHASNSTMRAIAKKQGRREEAVVTTFDVPQL